MKNNFIKQSLFVLGITSCIGAEITNNGNTEALQCGNIYNNWEDDPGYNSEDEEQLIQNALAKRREHHERSIQETCRRILSYKQPRRSSNGFRLFSRSTQSVKLTYRRPPQRMVER